MSNSRLGDPAPTIQYRRSINISVDGVIHGTWHNSTDIVNRLLLGCEWTWFQRSEVMTEPQSAVTCLFCIVSPMLEED